MELVGESIGIEGVKKIETVEIAPGDIDELFVRSSMQGTAETLYPLLIFLNYPEISTKESIWYDYSSHGSLAIERAQALLTLYEKHIIGGIRSLIQRDEIDDKLVNIVTEKFINRPEKEKPTGITHAFAVARRVCHPRYIGFYYLFGRFANTRFLPSRR